MIMKLQKNVFLLILCLALVNIPLRAQTFHAILFGDTNDESIGNTVKLDIERISCMLAEAQAALQNKISFEYDVNVANRCSPQNLRNVLNRLQCGKDDVVFLYYSGHGARSLHDTSKYPQMSLGAHYENELISAEGTFNIIKRKCPRLCIMITDCCNSYSENLSPKLELSKSAPCINREIETNYEDLFMKKSGAMIITSSKAGETSACNFKIGGFLTYGYLTVMTEANKQNISEWNNILEVTRDATVELSGNKQHPVFDVFVSDTVVSQTSVSTNESVVDESTDTMVIHGADVSANTQNQVLEGLRQLIDTNIAAPQRIAMVTPILNKYFSNANAIVEMLGRNCKTIVARETARNFLERLSTEYYLINFNVLSFTQDNNGKITSLRINEVYKK